MLADGTASASYYVAKPAGTASQAVTDRLARSLIEWKTYTRQF